MKSIIGSTFETTLVKTRKMSAQRYLKEIKDGATHKATFVPPRIGGSGFGHFEISLTTPRYEITID